MLSGGGLHPGQLREHQADPVRAAEGLRAEIQHPALRAAGHRLGPEGADCRAPVQQLRVRRAQVHGLERPGLFPRQSQRHELHRPGHLHHLRRHQRLPAADAGDAQRQRQDRRAADRRGRPPAQPQRVGGCGGGQRSRHQVLHHRVVGRGPAEREYRQAPRHRQLTRSAVCPKSAGPPTGGEAAQRDGEGPGWVAWFRPTERTSSGTFILFFCGGDLL